MISRNTLGGMGKYVLPCLFAGGIFYCLFSGGPLVARTSTQEAIISPVEPVQPPDVEVPVVQAFEPPSAEEREKDPLFQELKKVLMNRVEGGTNEPPSLAVPKGTRTPTTAGVKGSSISNRRWHAIELMLQSARLLDEESTQASAANEEVLSQQCSSVARRIRSEVVMLIEQDRGE